MHFLERQRKAIFFLNKTARLLIIRDINLKSRFVVNLMHIGARQFCLAQLHPLSLFFFLFLTDLLDLFKQLSRIETLQRLCFSLQWFRFKRCMLVSIRRSLRYRNRGLTGTTNNHLVLRLDRIYCQFMQALRRHQWLASRFVEHAAYVILKPGRLKDRIVYDIYFLVKLLDVGFYLLFFFDHCASSFLR